MIFAPAINTATFGVARQDSGVASALLNTMQQVGGSIGISALRTVALSTTASYLITHHTGALAPDVRSASAATAATAAPAVVPSPRAPVAQPAFEAIPVALCSCSPVVTAAHAATAAADR